MKTVKASVVDLVRQIGLSHLFTIFAQAEWLLQLHAAIEDKMNQSGFSDVLSLGGFVAMNVTQEMQEINRGMLFGCNGSKAWKWRRYFWPVRRIRAAQSQSHFFIKAETQVSAKLRAVARGTGMFSVGCMSYAMLIYSTRCPSSKELSRGTVLRIASTAKSRAQRIRIHNNFILFFPPGAVASGIRAYFRSLVCVCVFPSETWMFKLLMI